MAKTTGMGWTALTVADSTGSSQSIVNDVTNLDFATPQAMLDSTGLDKSAIERLLLLSDFSINLNGIFNDAVGQQHAVFRTVGLSPVSRFTNMIVAGSTLGATVLYSEYNLIRGTDGSLKWTAAGSLSSGNTPTWS